MSSKLTNMKEIFIRKLFLSLMVVFLLPSFFSEKLEAKIELLDKVIAVVDSGIIMESELKKRVEDIIWRLRNEGTELPPKKILEEYSTIKKQNKSKRVVIGFGITEKTIKSLKIADGLVVGSAICKQITNSIKKRQNAVTNVTNVVKRLKNKIK